MRDRWRSIEHSDVDEPVRGAVFERTDYLVRCVTQIRDYEAV